MIHNSQYFIQANLNDDRIEVEGFMKNYLAFMVIFFVVIVGGFVLYKSGQREKNLNEKKVAVSIFPIYDITRNIAGESIEIELILPAGASPHTYNPSPQEIRKIAGAKAIFSIGNGLDNWVDDLAKSADINLLVTLDKNIKLIDTVSMGNENGGDDPHYWLSPKNGLLIAAQVRDELIALYPEYKMRFEGNYLDYELKLFELDQEYEKKIAGFDNKEIATFHSAWKYLARDYDIDIVTTFEEFAGEDPTAEYLKNFSQQIQENKVKVIYAEPQFSSRPIEAIASDLGVEISFLDPVGGVFGRETYVELMLYNLSSLEEKLK